MRVHTPSIAISNIYVMNPRSSYVEEEDSVVEDLAVVEEALQRMNANSPTESEPKRRTQKTTTKRTSHKTRREKQKEIKSDDRRKYTSCLPPHLRGLITY